MSLWKYFGAAAGGVGGLVLGGPAGAVAGASLGYGVGASADAANESSDAAQAAQDAANGVTTPQVDPNAGIGGGPGVGSGWGGGPTQADQDAALAAYWQQFPSAAQTVAATKAKADAALAQGDTAGAAHWNAVYQKQVQSTRDGINQQLATAPDTTRFSEEAQGSYNRQAPQASMVTPDMANYSGDRSMFSSGGDALDNSLQSMRQNPIAAGQGQQQLINRLNSDLAGNAPSLAQAQLNQTTDQNIAAQRSMVASAGPMDYGAATRAAIMGGANAQQQAIGQAAIIRAQEYAQARGELGTAVTSQRGQTLQSFGMQNDVMVQKRAQELQAMGLDSQSAIQQAQLEAQQNLNNANLQAGQNQLNQNREMGYLDAYQKSRSMQQNNQQFNANANIDAQRIKAGLQGNAVQAQMQDASSQRQMAGSMIGAGSTFGASYMQSHPSAPSAPATKDYYDPSNPGF